MMTWEARLPQAIVLPNGMEEESPQLGELVLHDDLLDPSRIDHH